MVSPDADDAHIWLSQNDTVQPGGTEKNVRMCVYEREEVSEWGFVKRAYVTLHPFPSVFWVHDALKSVFICLINWRQSNRKKTELVRVKSLVWHTEAFDTPCFLLCIRKWRLHPEKEMKKEILGNHKTHYNYLNYDLHQCWKRHSDSTMMSEK